MTRYFYALEQQSIGQTQHIFGSILDRNKFLESNPYAGLLTGTEARKRSRGYTRIQYHVAQADDAQVSA